MAVVARRLVSKQKQRLKQDGFDLDLTYITDQVIAMGLPAEGTSALYRNPQSEVIRFLNTYHEKQFKIYNLCTRPQDQYDPEKFGGSVVRTARPPLSSSPPTPPTPPIRTHLRVGSCPPTQSGIVPRGRPPSHSRTTACLPWR